MEFLFGILFLHNIKILITIKQVQASGSLPNIQRIFGEKTCMTYSHLIFCAWKSTQFENDCRFIIFDEVLPIKLKYGTEK